MPAPEQSSASDRGSDPGAGSRLPSPLLAVATALLLAVVAYGGGNLFAGVAVGVLAGLGVELTVRRLLVVSIFSIQLVFFVGVSLAYLASRGLSLSDIGVRVPTLEDLIVLGSGFVGVVVLWLVASVVTFVAGRRLGVEREQQRIIELGMEDPTVFVVLAVLSVLVVGPAEELLFRGVIQTRLRETFGVVAGLTLPTALFAFIHLPGFADAGEFGAIELAGALLGVSVLFVVGGVLAVVYEYTGNLVVPAVIHGLFNATQAAFGYFAVRFADEEALGTLAEIAGVVPALV